MAKRRNRVFYCSIHGGPIRGRGWGGHKSHGSCPNGQRMTEAEFFKSGGAPSGVTAPRKVERAQRRAPAAPLEDGSTDLFKEAAALRDKMNDEIIRLEDRLDFLRKTRDGIEKILRGRD